MFTAVILYVTISVSWQTASLWHGFIKIKEKAKKDNVYDYMLDILRSLDGVRFMIPAMIIMGISIMLASPILFPIDLFRYLKRLLSAYRNLKTKQDQRTV